MTHAALVVAAVLLAGCGAGTAPTAVTAAHSPAGSAPTDHRLAPTLRYALGNPDTADFPVPACPAATANWTASSGELVVTVIVDGPSTVTVTVDSRAAQTAVIAAGKDTHDFHMPDVRASTVQRVLVAAPSTSQGPRGPEVGGQCLAQGSAN